MPLLSLARVALRRLRKVPTFSITVLLTLTLCVGANLVLFSVVNQTLLRPLPYPGSNRLVAIINSYPKAGYPRAGVSFANYYERRGSIQALASVSLYKDGRVVVGEDGSPQRVPVLNVTPEFFATLGVSLARGRTFTADELNPGHDHVAILTDEFWHSYFNGEPDVIGKTFRNDGALITVVGLLPRGFWFPGVEARFFRPHASSAGQRSPATRHSSAGNMIAQLAPGATVAQAQEQLAAVDAHAVATDPQAALIGPWGYHSFIRPFQADLVRDAKPLLVLLQLGAALLLAIGTANLVNLALIRANVRARELAVRQALGAGAGHIILESLAEPIVLTAVGTGAGLLLAEWGLRLVAMFGGTFLPMGAPTRIDPMVLVVALALALIITVLLAIPAWSLHLNARSVAGMASRTSTTSRSARRIRNSFVAIQVALAFVLLCGAGLLGLSLERVLRQPLGFQADHVMSGQLTLPMARYPDPAARQAFVDRLIADVRALPGVADAAICNGMPFTKLVGGGPVRASDSTLPPGSRAHHRVGVTADYARVMDIPVLRGRFLEEADEHADHAVCVIDQAMADIYWKGRNPLGERIIFGTPDFDAKNAATVVGVVETVKQNDLAEPDNFGNAYFPFSKFQTNFFYLAVRTELEPAVLAGVLRRAVRQIDPELPLDDIQTMGSRVDATLAMRRSPVGLAIIFAGMALLLAGVGLYGVLVYAVSLREKEFGIRMALGADREQVVWLVLSHAVQVVAIGIVVGGALSLLVSRYLSKLLFHTSGQDPTVFAVIAVIIGATGLIAGLIPALRATRVDPAAALRAE